MKEPIQLLVALCFSVLATTAACSDDDGADGSGGTSGSDGGSEAAAGSGGTGGASGSSGNGGNGGSSGTAGSAGAGASGGGDDGGSDAQLDADADAAGCLPPGSKYVFDICSTLATPNAHTTGIVPPYLGKAHADCRVAKLVDEHPALFELANKLTEFTLTLWGCKNDGVTTFDLVDAITDLSAADAALLIDFYVDLTTLELALSPGQQATLRDMLACLAESQITNPSTTEHELSSCVADGGADAGADAQTDAESDADAATGEAGPQDGGSD